MPPFVYLVLFNADSCEGRGPMIPKAIFSSKEEAEKFAIRNEPYGGNRLYMNEVQEFPLWRKSEDVITKEYLRKSALAKLSCSERKALGV